MQIKCQGKRSDIEKKKSSDVSNDSKIGYNLSGLEEQA